MMYYGVIGAVMAYMFLYQYNGKRGCIDTYFVKNIFYLFYPCIFGYYIFPYNNEISYYLVI